MRKLNLFLFIAILLLSAQKIFAYNFYTKEIHKGFLYKEDIKLHISNQHGNISVIPVEQDSITIDITVCVEHFDEEKGLKLLNEVNFNFSQINNTAKSETVITHLFKTGLKFRIDYIVKMPSGVKLDINNNFGDIFLDGTIKQETKINLNYGKLTINKITNTDSLAKHLIKLNYSQAKINVCDNVKLISNYSKVKIKNSKEIILASSFSKLELDSNEYLIANCNHDTYFIKNTISTDILRGAKSNISIGKLQEKANINLDEGNINIVANNSCKDMNIKTKNVNAHIYMDEILSYGFQIETKNCNIKYPENAEIISSEKNTFEDTQIIKGVLGKQDNINSRIIINSTKGSVIIK